MNNEQKTDKTIDFEASMQELEGIVRKLETGNLPLEESIKLYQRGLELYGICFDRLEKAEDLIVKMNNQEETK